MEQLPTALNLIWSTKLNDAEQLLAGPAKENALMALLYAEVASCV
jgi:hypothetical protein